MGKLKYVDAIRGIAIIAVFMTHVANSDRFPGFIQKFIQAEAKGVQLFFIASAFTLFLSMDKRENIEHYPTGNFFIRRFFRIAPMYYLAIIYYYFQNSFAGLPHSIGLTISNFIFLHGLSPKWINALVPGGWSISTEMLFYCIVPFIFDWVSNLNRAVLFLLFTLCFRFLFLVLMYYVVLPERTDEDLHFLYYCLPNQLPVFALGFILFHYVKSGYRFAGIKLQILVFLVLSLVVNSTIKDLIPYHFFISIGLAVFCVYLGKTNTPLFVNKFTIFLGKISFSLYLVHFGVRYWIDKLIDHSNLSAHLNFLSFYPLRVISIFLLSVLLAAFFQYAVEVPFQSVGKRIIRRREDRFIPVINSSR
jgi:peptidoglycan/LPS O-acetylase OafA/YrhL